MKIHRMRLRVGAVGLLLVAWQGVHFGADACPIEFIGSIDGLYYHSCVDIDSHCEIVSTSVHEPYQGVSSRQHDVGCEGTVCRDPIIGGGYEIVAPKGIRILSLDPTKPLQEKYAHCRGQDTSLGGCKEQDGTKFPEGRFRRASKRVTVSDDVQVTVKMTGGAPRYFRILKVDLTYEDKAGKTKQKSFFSGCEVDKNDKKFANPIKEASDATWTEPAAPYKLFRTEISVKSISGNPIPVELVVALDKN